MKPRPVLRLWPAALLLAAVVIAEAAYTTGGSAYTKRVETNLFSEPSSDSRPAGKLGFRRKVKVDQVQGGWLRVSDGPTGGWVFSGNLAVSPPDETKGLDGLPLTASQTSAAAAARPLTPEANEYAARRSLGSARVDLDWLQAQCKGVTAADVEAFLKVEKKGEFQ